MALGSYEKCKNFRIKIEECRMSKQRNDTFVSGTMIVPKQKCFCLLC